MINKKKFVLGTAQFGNAYGISNIKKKKLHTKEVFRILRYCNQNGIRLLDTAYNYGKSQRLIGKFNNNFKICTKLFFDNCNEKNLKKFINIKLNLIFKELKKKKIKYIIYSQF